MPNKNFLYLWLLVVLLWIGLPTPSYAQSDTIQIQSNRVAANFPENITFLLKAQVAQNQPRIAWVELAFRLEDEVPTNVRRQSINPTDHVEIEFAIDTQKDYMPPGTRLNYYWTLCDENNQTYQTPTQSLVYQDTRYNFKELTNEFVMVRWYSGDLSFGEAALSQATNAIARLSQQYNVEPNRPINITIYPDTASMFTALPPNTVEWVGGQTIPELGTIVIAARPGDLSELKRSIPHEISHQVVHQATHNPYNIPPRWLDEGLAVNNQDQLDAFLQISFEQGQAKRILYPLRVLNGSFPADQQASFLAYAQSLQIVRYIIKKYGNKAIEKMLVSFKEGLSYDEIVERGTGLSLDELDWQWKNSIGYPQAAFVKPTAPAPTVANIARPTSVAITPTDQPTVEANPLKPISKPRIINAEEPPSLALIVLGVSIGLLLIGSSLMILAKVLKKA